MSSRRFARLLSFAVVAGVAAGLFAAPQGQPDRKPRKVAFLVGVGKYDHKFPDLGTAPENDVGEMAKTLAGGGFEVVTLTGTGTGGNRATRANIEDRFKEVLRGGGGRPAVKDGDIVLVLLCGHGLQDKAPDPATGKVEEQPLFCPVDAWPDDTKTLVPLNGLIRASESSGATTLFLVDACREVLPDANRGTRTGIQGKKLTLPAKTAVLFACAAGQLSHQDGTLGENKKGHGLFTFAVLKTLRAADAGQRVSWTRLVTGVEEAFESDEFKAMLPKGKGQSPVLATGELGATELLAAKTDGTIAKKPTTPVLPRTGTEWPQWRGPTRDGISRETGLLKSWPANGPPVAWTAADLGLGFGAPIVVGGKVYGTGSRDGKDGIWAVNEADGKEVWFTAFSPTAKTGQQNYGPCSSPAFANGKLYAVGIGGTLACLDAASGREIWKKEYVQDFGGKVPVWGYSDSPLVDGDRVIATPCGPGAAVVALKADTGEVIWKTDAGELGTGHGYSSPVKATVAAKPMYVVLLGKTAGLVGVDADTGKVLWRYTKAALGGIAQIPTPVVKGDRVWLSTAYSGGSAVLELVPDKDAFAVRDVKTFGTDLMNHHGGTVLVGDYLYFGHGQNLGYLACVSMRTGELKWGPVKDKTALAGGEGSAAVAYADGRVYVRYEKGTMLLVDPSPDGLKVVSSFKLPPANHPKYQQSWPHPVVANGKLYVRDQNVMYAYDIRGGN